MSLHFTPIAELPIGVKNGVGGLIGRRLYVGLGSAGKRLFFYDLNQPELDWQEAAQFPGVARNDAVSIATQDRLYVFSGAGIVKGDGHLSVLTDGYYFDAPSNQWHQVETSLPIGLLGASGFELSPGKLVFLGGYCKETFDTLFAQLSEIDNVKEPDRQQSILTEFMSRPPKAYGWNSGIWQLNVETGRWRLLSINPFAANCGAGLVKQGNTITLVEGEVKPGLRSLETKQFVFQTESQVESSALPAIVDEYPDHEGLAGGYITRNQGQLFAAGGTYFIGSQNNAKKGQWYSHKGLTKHYNDNVWRFDGKRWHHAGRLPTGLAYGVAISNGQSIYLLGGEDSTGNAQQACYLMDWQ